MKNEDDLFTAESAKSLVSGLVLMSLFTLFWTGVAYYGLKSTPYWWLLGLFPLACVFFLYHAFGLRKAVQHLPEPASTADDVDAKKRQKWFMYICSAEGIGIFLAVNIVVNLHHPELQVPAIALPVSLHFFPLAKVFKRRMDYYLGAWSTLIVLSAITLSLNHTLGKMPMIVFTGVGLALATTSYGLNMMLKARRVPIH